MAHSEAPVKVVKLTGLGRSGSTILDVVLGNHPQIESVGEVGDLIRNGWISRKSLRGIPEKSLRVPLCTCGKRLDVLYVDAPEEACPFWSRVRREWVERVDPRDDIEGYPKLQNDSELERRLRYEDFVADPEAALGRIGSLIGLDLAGVADAASSGEPLRVGHNIGGNRTKKSGYLTLRPDAREWEGTLSPAEQRLAWALLGWLMRRYGYGR
jgi:hypothetical protein